MKRQMITVVVAAAGVAVVGLSGTAQAAPGYAPVKGTPGQVRGMVSAIQAQLDAIAAGDTARVKQLSCGFFADDLLYHPKILTAISAETRTVDGRITVARPRAATVANNLGRVTVDARTAKRNPKAATSVRFTLDRTSGTWKVCAASTPYVSFAGLSASA
ncbi:Rv0361 family membrane protein [Tsukamurella soli]|uniref:Rv0361 family membrane protein n=1 Tax=Tsukamurella soli TaxID=644556 RepID=UPI0031F14F4C